MPYGDCDTSYLEEDEREMEAWGNYQRDNYTEAAARASSLKRDLELLQDRLTAVNVIRVKLTKMWQEHCWYIPDTVEEILRENLIELKKLSRQ
jgi:hypothetical protein